MAYTMEQLDKVSLQYVIITKAQRKYIKKQRSRKLRRASKNINNPNPLYNRYQKWAG